MPDAADTERPCVAWAALVAALLDPPDVAALLARCRVTGRRISRWDLADEVEAAAATAKRYGPRKPKA